MDRLEAFNSMATHPMLGKQFTKLNHGEVVFCQNFIRANATSSDNDYAVKAVRLFLDINPKPKNWQAIEELLICAMSKAQAHLNPQQSHSHPRLGS